MKLLRGSETNARHGHQARDLAAKRGFSLIELMVVLAVVAVLGAVAAVGFRRNEFANQRARFIADCEGVLVQARNAAVDGQTRVRVEVEAAQIRVSAFDTTTDTWTLVDRAALENFNASLLTAGGTPPVCVYGLTGGVMAPSQSANIVVPSDCVAGTQRLLFEADGRFTDPDGLFEETPNAGATLWIADRTLPQTRYSIVQVYPGGLVRTFEDLE